MFDLPRGKTCKLLAHSVLVFALMHENSVWANPQGGVVVDGQAQINSVDNTLTVNQQSQNAIVNWDSFNIGRNEHTQFVQPPNGVILNRINANNGASEILGQLSANGTVVLVNQAGMLFGKNAQVNVGAIIASTADISNENFRQNNFHFDHVGLDSAAIINLGTINAKDHGLVALLGPTVRNDGLINAKLGKIALAQGTQFIVDLNSDDLISFVLPEKNQSAPNSAGVSNNGEIYAAGGQVLLTANAAEGVLDQAINMSGIIEATTLQEQHGKIIFAGNEGNIVISGKIDTSSQQTDANAGEINVLGKNIFIKDTAQLKADAKENGNGGKVIVIAEDDTNFFGNITAKGGTQNGNGGFVEISGKTNLQFEPATTIDTTAINGRVGDLLLDPAFLIVQTAGGSAYSNGVNNLYANNTGGTNTITPASIVTAAVGANIILQANTDITITNALAITTTGRTLTMNAGRSVLINAAVSTTNGAINITANDTSAISADRAAGAGNITMVGSTLSSGTAPLTLSVGVSNAPPFTSGNITALGLTGSVISLTTPNALTGTTIAASTSLTVDIGTDSAITGIISGTGATLTKHGAGLLNLSGINTYTGATSILSGTLRASSSTAFGSVAGGVVVSSGATMEINGVSIGTEAVTLNGTGVGGAGALIGTGTASLSGTIALASNTTIGGTGTMTLSGIMSGAFNLTKVGTGSISLSGANTYGGTTAVTAGTLRASNATALGSIATTITIDSGATLDINGVAVGAKPLSISGTGVSAAGALTGTGTSSYAGAVTMLADTTLGGTGTFTISGIIGGGFNLTKIGSSTISLSGINSYSGTTNINVGTLRASNAAALGSNAATAIVASGATLDINGVAIGAKTLSISGTGVSGNGALTGTGTGSYAGAITLLGDTNLGGTGTYTLSGVIDGGFNINKLGTGIAIFSNTNTYTGTTTVTAGTLRISTDANLGPAPGGATPGSIVLAGGTLQATAAFTLNANRGIALNSNSTIRTDVSTFTYNGIIAGTGGLTKTGAGIMALGGPNTYSGPTTISASTLSLTTPNAITNTSALSLANVAGVTLLLNNNNQTIGSLSGGGTTGGTITLGSGTLSVNQTAAGTYAGTITGTGGLTLTSSSTNTLSLTNASNSYSGITTINAGAISIISDTNLGTTPGVATPGKIVLNGGTLTANASFTLSANRGIALNGAGGTLQVNPTFTLTYNGLMAGAAAFTKAGTGTLSSNSVQTYTGATNINSGTFLCNVANQLINSTSISFADDTTAILNFNNFNQTLNNLSGGGTSGGELALGTASLTVNQTSAGNFAGPISGSGDITLSNTSNNTLTLSNTSNTFTGNLNINGGILAVSSDSNLGTVPGVTTPGKINFNGGTLRTTANMTLNADRGIAILASGATISTDADTALTYSGIIAGSASGALNKAGTGTLILSGSNTYDGATAITAGILSIESANALGNTTGTTVTNGAMLQFDFNAATLGNNATMTLNGTGVNNAGALSFYGSNITINNPLSIATSSSIGGTGGGSMNFAGAITGSAALDISLSNAAIVLPAITLTGANLTVTAGGNITQNGAITPAGGGSTSFGVTTAASNIILDQANNFGGVMPTFTGTLSNIQDFYLRDVNAAATIPSFSGLSNLRNLSLVFNNAALALPSITLTNSGALVATASGAITQTGILTVPGTSTLSAGSNPITLGQNNLLTGAVSLNNSGANNVSINNATNLSFGTSSVGQNLTVTTVNGAITQTGAITVPGTTSFNPGANRVLLLSPNVFTGAVSISNTGTNNINIRNNAAFNLGTIVAGQDLLITSAGNITQSGTITAPNGTSAFASTAANSDFTLNAANNFGIAPPVFAGTTSNIRDIYLRNTNANAAMPSFAGLSNVRNLTVEFNNSALQFPAITLTNSGNLVATAVGAITQSGALVVPGTTNLTVSNTAVTLTNASNAFTGVVTINGASSISLNNTTSMVLPATTVTGNYSIVTTGAITQSGILTVPGKATFSAGANPITLNSNNVFSSVLSLSNSSNNDVSVNNNRATIIGASTIGRNLSITSAGTISQSDAITATGGTSSFNVTVPSSSILLGENNNFGTIAPVFAGTTSNISRLVLKNINSSAATPALTSLTSLTFLELITVNATTTLSSLSVPGLTIFMGNNVTGDLTVHGLQLNTNYCNLTGFVNGLSGQEAIDQITLLNTIQPNTHFFDGIDMYGSNPTPPTPTPTPDTTTVVTATVKSDIANQLYVANSFINETQTNDIETAYYAMLDADYTRQADSNDGDCVSYGGEVEICY